MTWPIHFLPSDLIGRASDNPCQTKLSPVLSPQTLATSNSVSNPSEHQCIVSFHELKDAGILDLQLVVSDEVPPRCVQPLALEVATIAHRPRSALAEEHDGCVRLREVALEARREVLISSVSNKDHSFSSCVMRKNE
jgi:hypothetical protein